MISKINKNPVKGYPTFGIPLGPLAEDRLLKYLSHDRLEG